MIQPDFQPTLVGPTTIVRPIAPGDWTELYAIGSDPEVWRLHPVSQRYTEPARFDLSYVDRSGGRARPVMVHRSLVGSMERLFAHLIEAHAGTIHNGGHSPV